jgi:predicted GNAT family acetyltransferase
MGETGEQADVRVDEDRDREAFVLRVEGVEAGHADVRRRRTADGTPAIVLVHTEVDEAYSGRGLGGRLVRGVFDAARAEGPPGTAVAPRCPYAQRWLGSHPEYLADVPARDRAALGLGEPHLEETP